MSKKAKTKETAELEKGLILYTDGGCRPGGRGIAGWGIHGYSYQVKPTKPGKKENATTSIGYHTINMDDGAFDDDGYWRIDIPAKRTEAVVYNPENYIDAWGTIPAESTNNVAELMAFKKGIELAETIKPANAVFWLDSEYVLNGVKDWHPKWIANNWMTSAGKPVANADLWKEVIADLETAKKTINFTFDWTRGHNGDLGNELADINATRAVIAGKKGLELEEIRLSNVANYWNRKSTVNRLLGLPFWYFAVNRPTPVAKNGNQIYHIGAHGPKLTMAGKRVSDHAYAVVMLKTPDEALETVREFQNTDCNHAYERVIVADLAKIFLPENYHELTISKDKYLFRATHQNDIYDVKEDRYTEELVSPLLLFRATEQLSNLETRLEDFLDGTLDCIKVDITSTFYEMTTKGKKEICALSKNIKQTVRSITVPVNVGTGAEEKMVNFVVNVGQDIANRNTLNAIAEGSPKVTLLVERETARCYRHWTVIEVGDDASIWSSVYANQTLLLE